MTLQELKNDPKYQSADMPTKGSMIRGLRLQLTPNIIHDIEQELDTETLEIVLRGFVAISNDPTVHSQGPT